MELVEEKHSLDFGFNKEEGRWIGEGRRGERGGDDSEEEGDSEGDGDAFNPWRWRICGGKRGWALFFTPLILSKTRIWLKENTGQRCINFNRLKRSLINNCTEL